MLSVSGRTNDLMDYSQKKETPAFDELVKASGEPVDTVWGYVRSSLSIDESDKVATKLVQYYLDQGMEEIPAEDHVMDLVDKAAIEAQK